MNKFKITLQAAPCKNESDEKLSEKTVRIISNQTENAFKIYITRLENELVKKEIEEDELFSGISARKNPYVVSVHQPCTIESFPETLTLMRLKVDSIQKQLDMARKCYHEYFDDKENTNGYCKRTGGHVVSENKDDGDINADKISPDNENFNITDVPNKKEYKDLKEWYRKDANRRFKPNSDEPK